MQVSGVMNGGGRYRPEVLFLEKNFFGGNHVSLTRIARSGDLLTHMFSYNDTKTFRVNEEILSLRVGGEHWNAVKLTAVELADVATMFFRFREAPHQYTEIVITIEGGTFGNRTVMIPEKAFARVEACLGQYRRAPLHSEGVYR